MRSRAAKNVRGVRQVTEGHLALQMLSGYIAFTLNGVDGKDES